MRYAIFPLIVAVCSSTAQAVDLEKLVPRGSVMALRAATLEDGKKQVPVTLAAGTVVKVSKTEWKNDKLVVVGTRVAMLGDNLSMPFDTGVKTKVFVSVHHGADEKAIKEALAKTFLSAEEVRSAAQNYFSWTVPKLGLAPAGAEVGRLKSARSVYKVGNGVKAPKLTKSVDPQDIVKFGSRITTLRCVIDESGAIAMMEVWESSGNGLDAAAVTAVSQWRFEPGTKNGIAVPVVVKVEIRATQPRPELRY